MNIEIYIISLKDSTGRRVNIEEQFRVMGINFLWFDAVDGRKQQHPLFERYNEAKRMLYRGKNMVGGQLGCFASHFLLWEKCVELNKPIIILEDDARLQEQSFLEFIACANNLPDRYGCVRLFTNQSKNYRLQVVEKFNNFSLAKFSKGHMRTTGYYITPWAAKKFIEGADEWVFPVDIYMDRFWANHVECYGILPVCLEDDQSFDTEINYTHIKKYSFCKKINRELFSFTEVIRRTLWNLSFRIKNYFH
jgi:glycosyl transferase family 25